MSPSTAPPFCSLTRSARIAPLTRPQTVTVCAMTLPSTCAPSLIWRSEARTSPSIRPKTCAGPLQSILPMIDMSEPMQEAVPAFVVGSDLAQVWSCGTTLPMTSAAPTDAFLSFSGAALCGLITMCTSWFRRASGGNARIAPLLRTQYQRYHLLSAPTLNNSRNRNFVHRKDHLRLAAADLLGHVFACLLWIVVIRLLWAWGIPSSAPSCLPQRPAIGSL